MSNAINVAEWLIWIAIVKLKSINVNLKKISHKYDNIFIFYLHLKYGNIKTLFIEIYQFLTEFLALI